MKDTTNKSVSVAYNSNATSIPEFYNCSSNIDNSIEQWRDVEGFEGLYEVSNWGRIKSLHRGKEKILKPMHRNCDKYLRVALYRKGQKVDYRYLHRIVATAFIPNPYNLPEVNHINTDPRDCNVNNLEWTDRKHNLNYYLTRLNKSKTVYCYDAKTMNLMYVYSSVSSCANCIGTNPSYVSTLVKKGKEYKGFILKYA